MKHLTPILILVCCLTTSCEKGDNNNQIGITDGFCLAINDSVVLNHFNIDFYDFSSHLIYLKTENSFLNSEYPTDSFTVYANGEKIYSGKAYSLLSSGFPIGPLIYREFVFYNKNIMQIGFGQFYDSLGISNPDPRSDSRIKNALIRYNQYHAGLSCEIKSLVFTSQNSCKLELSLQNNDSFNYYYLDPEKMGINFYHYFTTGLYLMDFQNHTYLTHNIQPLSPEQHDNWKMEWLSLIKSNETKIITITYYNFETVAAGNYMAFFNFPGLKHQVEKHELQQSDGLIWLGELNLTKEITVK